MRRQLEIRSVVDQVHAELLERIVAGELAPGSRLRQEALADELGVSRTPLREALARLVSEGLVEFVPNRGATVTRRDFTDMEEAWRARFVIEPGAARLAAERRAGDEVERMRELVRRQRSVADDVTSSFALNRDFHLALVAASANTHLLQFSELLWLSRIGVPIFARQARDRSQMLAWADDHEAIAEAVAAGDPDRAERLTREHIAAYPPAP
ncbi:MAG TPA: GntR family transcriptional regulator [Gaiellaceae bacterium]|nr:GntR family transcriptional regulator [Gaiellaceae bacterium]